MVVKTDKAVVLIVPVNIYPILSGKMWRLHSLGANVII